MAYVARMAEWHRTGPDGSDQRATWALAAQRGNRDAMEKMRLPEFPDALAYLHEWFEELSSSRGVGLSGPAPLTYQGIAAWAALTDRHPAPHEVQALLALDRAWLAAMCADGETKPTANDASDRLAPRRAWPSKKPQPEAS